LPDGGEYGAKLVTSTIGGCSVNTSLAANLYLRSLYNLDNRVITVGAVGSDDKGERIQKELDEHKIINFLHTEPNTQSGSCAVAVVNNERTCIGVLDACESYPISHMENVLK
jgi:sugar/nucleoside kinase (ribokinase family)